MTDGLKLATLTCPAPLKTRDRILLGHGSGGKLSAELVRDIFLPAFGNPTLAQLNDQAVVQVNGSRLAITTDSFVVKPLFFPGGDIGSLAVHGTINDLAVGGAQPLFLSVAFILEEGLSMETLQRVVNSLRSAANDAGVQIVTGDTKVVEKGKGDDLFINTTGIGIMPEGLELSADQAQPGDKVILSGYIGDHGIAILAQREGLEFETTIKSDSAALHGLVVEMLKVKYDGGTPLLGGVASSSNSAPRAATSIRCMRDPTRGGLSSTLNEIAGQSRVGIEIEEEMIPVRDDVRGACEMLGLDPLYVANEGKLVAIVVPDAAGELVKTMRQHPLGREARIIGTVTDKNAGLVTMRTTLGTTRIVDMLAGDQLPRIC
ncbi:MAG TPA: hydrogenase expression/formation protein HypE [Terriglobales bacterium]|nr:hydrogenase expression/formation protein HypE [Terriglobales bacterium]